LIGKRPFEEKKVLDVPIVESITEEGEDLLKSLLRKDLLKKERQAPDRVCSRCRHN
jgi:hypothetical protein